MDVLWILAIVLLVLWLVGFFLARVGGALIHLLLILAAIIVVYQLVL